MSRVITFYSYKGGTGRSMALANIAGILASAGKRVLAIDWDLEAPGLHRYFQPFLTDKELCGQESQGVVEMAIDFAVKAATHVKKGETLSDKWYQPYADFSKWRQKLRWSSGETVRLGKNGRGAIDFVSAGRQGPDYAKRVNSFDWYGFYEKLNGGAFYDEAKRKFDLYDYVLIDSRTGVSDTSGICTVHMPDTLVVCFTLNYQSIKGALAVAQSVRDQRPEMRIFPVPMRIDGSEEKLLNRMKKYAADSFTPLLGSEIDAEEYWYSMEVPYLARYAYAEKLALFEERASITASTLPAIERLSAYLTAGEVRTAGPLPEPERVLALAEFEGIKKADRALPATPIQLFWKYMRLFWEYIHRLFPRREVWKLYLQLYVLVFVAIVGLVYLLMQRSQYSATAKVLADVNSQLKETENRFLNAQKSDAPPNASNGDISKAINNILKMQGGINTLRP